ncbi:MAG: hypothetical protein JWR36_1163 [Glaciihabitans sp.]|nr:hypothetical protein [Glaciihabitans sp.]
MRNLATALVESAAAVATLGGSQVDIDALDDASVIAGFKLITEHERHVQALKLAYATTLTRRSSYELGYAGLARRSGSATPQLLIQTLTGSSTAEATKLANLGAMVIEVENAAAGAAHSDMPAGEAGSSVDSAVDSAVDGAVDGAVDSAVDSADPTESPAWQAPLVAAVAAGQLSLDSADAIRRGLGVVDSAVTTSQLREAAVELAQRAVSAAGSIPPERLWRAARDLRNELDAAAIARGEKQRADQRYERRFHRDGMFGGSWLLPEEEGGRELDQALSLILAPRTGGPRFPETTAGSTAAESDDQTKRAEELLRDTRTNEQVLADGFVQVLRNGLAADSTVLPGKGRAAVRVIVTEQTLEAKAGQAIVEGSGTPIAFSKVEQALCDTGLVGVMFDHDGQSVNIGRELRLFSARQRIGLAVRDGGCRAPGCDKPPSWCEAHHINYWARDRGRTDIADGILLCRYHHMLFHNNGWEIVRDGGNYWLKPPQAIDPTQAPVEMPTKNPIIAALKRAGPESDGNRAESVASGTSHAA